MVPRMNCPEIISFTPTLALFGDIGGGELLVVLAAALILFGGKGLPTIARTLGKITGDLQRIAGDFKQELLNADQEPRSPASPEDFLEPDAKPRQDPAPSLDNPPPEEPPPRDHAG